MTEPIPIQGWGLSTTAKRDPLRIPSSFRLQTPLPPSQFKHSIYDKNNNTYNNTYNNNSNSNNSNNNANNTTCINSHRLIPPPSHASHRSIPSHLMPPSDSSPDEKIHVNENAYNNNEKRLNGRIARRIAMRESLETAPLPIAWIQSSGRSLNDKEGGGGESDRSPSTERKSSSKSSVDNNNNSLSFLLRSRTKRYHHPKKQQLPALNRATFRQYMATTQPLLTPSTVAKRFSKITEWQEELLKRKVQKMR